MLRPAQTLAAALTVTATLAISLMLRAEDRPRSAGPTDRGFLLPNGWTITPAGQQVPLADLPLNILPLADGRHALVATSGYNTHALSLIDLADGNALDSETVGQSWYGLVAETRGDRIWWSGGGGDRLHTFRRDGRELTRVGEPEPESKEAQVKAKGHFRSGLALGPD